MITLVPLGLLAGAPMVTVDASRLDLSDPLALVSAVLTQIRPGVQAVQLDQAGPHWGSPALDAALSWLASDGRTGHLVVWVHRPCTEAAWPALPAWTVLDCTPVVKSMADESIQAMADAINALPFLPAPREVILEMPEGCRWLSPAHLMDLAARLDIESDCWLLVHPDDLDHATHVAASAPGWSVRAAGC